MHCVTAVYFLSQTHTTTNTELAASFVASDCCNGLIHFHFDVFISVYLFCLLSVAKLYDLLTVHFNTPVCNKNQPDARFILSLFRHSTSTCFGHICSPSSGGILYIYIYKCCAAVGYKYARNMYRWTNEINLG